MDVPDFVPDFAPEAVRDLCFPRGLGHDLEVDGIEQTCFGDLEIGLHIGRIADIGDDSVVEIVPAPFHIGRSRNSEIDGHSSVEAALASVEDVHSHVPSHPHPPIHRSQRRIQFRILLPVRTRQGCLEQRPLVRPRNC